MGKLSKLTGLLTLFCLAALLSTACDEGDYMEGDLLFMDEEGNGPVKHSLYGNKNLYWPGTGSNRVDIKVCWENPNSTALGSTSSARSSYRDARRAAIEQSWGRFARINFWGWGTCQTNDPGLHVYICTSNSDPVCSGQNGASQANNPSTGISGYPGLNGTTNGIRMNRLHGPSIMVHEFGHALGYYHEEEIPNSATGTGGCAQQSYPNENPTYYGDYDRDGIMSYCSPPTTAPFLSSNDITAAQRTFGRHIHGSIVSTRGMCAAAVSRTGTNSNVFLWDCDEYAGDQEWFDSTSTANGDATSIGINRSWIYGGGKFCMAPTSTASGSNVVLKPCTTSNDWLLRNMEMVGFGGKCMDLQSGNTTNGTPIQMWSCGALDGANQKWTITADGHLKYKTTNKCARIVNGRLVIWDCQNWNSQKFTLNNGKIVRKSSGKCLDVIGPCDYQYTQGQGLPYNGMRIQEYTCNSAMNQKWNLHGQLRYAANSNRCLDRKWAEDRPGADIWLYTCNSSDAQLWDYYF